MGVIDGRGRGRRISIVQPHNTIDNGTDSSEELENFTTSIAADAIEPPPTESLEARRVNFPPNSPSLARAKKGHKLTLKKGKRSKRRFDNEKLLINLMGRDPEEDIDFDDLLPETNCAFTELLFEENRELLNLFIDHEINVEDERSNKSKLKKQNISPASLNEEISSDTAFKMLNIRLQIALKKNPPIGMLESIEYEITNYFDKNPTSKYVMSGLSSLQRLLLHAVCSYNMLHSHSYNDRCGSRMVKIINSRSSFTKMTPLLTEYLSLHF